MEQLLKETGERIETLCLAIEEGQKVVNELEYRTKLQVITNDININERNSLQELLDEQNSPRAEKVSRY